MLLPSGRSNSDVHPLQSTQKVPFLTRTSSPQLSLAPAPATAQQQQQQQLKPHQYQQQQLHQQQATATATAATTTTIATIAENGFTLSTATTTTATTSPGSQSETGTDRISTAATTKTTATTTATPYPMTFLGYNNNSNSNANNSNNNSCSSSETTTPLIKTSQPPALPLSEVAAAATTTTKAATTTTTTGTTAATTAAAALLATSGNWEEIDRHLEALQSRLKEGWTVHVGKDGRLYYCNHLTQTAGWLPSCEDWSRSEQLPYGWERAIDSKGRSYYINHINKTSTYEAPESVRWDENPPEPRVAVLERSPTLGFGFVAGSERPVIVRFVTDGGPSMNKLQPGDQILAVNGEDVKEAPRDHVIQLVRACEAQVTLLVCQPAHTFVPGRKSTLLSAGKRAKLRSRPSRVRFAESVCVNGAPLFPPSAFSLGDICVPPMANVLKVFLENGQTKSFKYDATTTVQDVVTSLLDKLCLATGELCSLVLEHVKSLRRNKLTLLDPEESLARIAARPGAHKLRCLFRVTFVPISAAELAQRDLNALDYLYMQCCNDVTQERFAPELQPEVALRLAALHMHQHALANNVSPSKLTVKIVEREFGLERFVPASLFEGMKRKELRRLVSHFLKLNAEMTGSSAKVLTQLQAKLHYLDIIAGLPSYGAKCFSTNQREGVERVLLVSPRFGLSQISSVRNSVPQPISAIEDFSHVIVRREDDVTCSVAIFMLGERVIKFSMEDRDACEFSLVLAGYYRLMTGQELPVDREREQFDEDNSPSYLAQHTVLPAAWSYLQPFHNRAHSINFLMSPPYHAVPLQLAKDAGGDQRQCDRNMNSPQVANGNHRQQRPGAKPMKLAFLGSAASTDLDMHSVMATELLEEAKDSGLSDSSGGGSGGGSASGLPASHYYSDRAPNGDGGGGVGGGNAFLEAKNEEVLRRVQEMQKMVESSEQYLTEQGEQVAPEEAWQQLQHQPLQRRTWQNESVNSGGSTSTSTNGQSAAGGIGPGQGQGLEFDSDCDSLNSSKVSSNEETPQPGALKHSDSLVLLAEAINQDLTGITKGLNSIGGAAMAAAELGGTASPAPGQGPGLSISAASSPRPERRLNGFGQLLSNLQALGNDYSQSESDSESVHSPTSSPTTRRPSLLTPTAGGARKQNVAYRSSFGLHSPDGSHFGPETKDYNLKEYLKQLKEISNVEEAAAGGEPGPDTAGAAARKLSEIYGFEIREDTFIETDSDLIDLRAIPPPQTPDELDALSLLNAPPQGFDDGSSASRRSAASASASASVSASQAAPPETEADLDRFLAKVVVAPPTQKATPAKELTPEEIMSFIIPPPPNLEDAERTRQQERDKGYGQTDESLYSNSQTMKGAAEPGSQPGEAARVVESETRQHAAVGHVIEYATVERKSKFSCCPKSRKEEPPPPPLAEDCVDAATTPGLELPPRRGRGADEGAPPPLRPPKSAELLSRYSPKKQLSQQSSQPPPRQPPPPEGAEGPPTLPPRSSPSQRPPPEEQQRSQSPAVSPAPKKPPLPPFASRPVLPRGVGSASATAPFPNGSIGPGAMQQHQQPQSPPPPLRHAYQTNGLLQTNTSTSTSSTLHSPHSNGLHLHQHQHQHQHQQQPPYHHRQRSNSDCPPAGPQTPPPLPPEKRPPLSLLCSPQMPRKAQPQPQTQSQSQAHSQGQAAGASGALIIKNGHVIDGEALLAKTDVAMAGLLVKLDQVAAQCSAAQAAGGGASINEEKFQRARNELTEQTLALVTASKYLVVSMSDMKLATLPEHLTSCLTAIRRITELTQDMTRHTSAPLQTRNIVLKVHDVASSFRELVGVQVGPLGAGQLALQAECLANVLATLLRSLRVFSP